MNPSVQITQLDELQKQLNRLRSHLADEAETIEQQWYALGRIGGQRADAAAGLLSKLRPHLIAIGAFCADCAVQIDLMAADPFQRNAKE